MRSVLAIPHLIGVLIFWAALESSVSAGFTFAIEPFVKEVKSTSPTEFEITYEWWVGFVPNSNAKVFVHFTDSKGTVIFKDDFDPDPPLTKWPQSRDGKRLRLAPRKMKIPENITGPFEIRMGTHGDDHTGGHAILGTSDDKLRVKVGQIKVEDGKVVFDESKSIGSSSGPKNDAISKDRKLSDGTWKCVELLVNGEKQAGDQAMALTIISGADGSWSVRDGNKGEVSKGTSSIDPTKNPKTIDLTPTLGEGAGKQFFGIYEVTESTRRLCFDTTGNGRPTEFLSKPGSILVTFERMASPKPLAK